MTIRYETILHPQRKQIPVDQVFRFKLADSLGKRMIVTGMPANDWAYARDQKPHVSSQ